LDGGLISTARHRDHPDAIKSVPPVHWLPENVCGSTAPTGFPVRFVCSVSCVDTAGTQMPRDHDKEVMDFQSESFTVNCPIQEDEWGEDGRVLADLRGRSQPPYELMIPRISAAERSKVLLALLNSRGLRIPTELLGESAHKTAVAGDSSEGVTAMEQLEHLVRSSALYGSPFYLTMLSLCVPTTNLPTEPSPSANHDEVQDGGRGGGIMTGLGQIVARLACVPLSIQAATHVFFSSLEEDTDEGGVTCEVSMTGRLLAALSVSRIGLLEEEAWELIQQSSKDAKRYRYCSLLRALGLGGILVGARASRRAVSTGWGEKDSGGGAADFGAETALILSSRIFVQAAIDRYLLGGKAGGTEEGREAEYEIHADLSHLFHRGVSFLEIDQLGYGQEEWKEAHCISDRQARSVSEVGYHTIRGGGYSHACSIEQVVDLLQSLRLIEVRFMLRLLPQILLDLEAAQLRIAQERAAQEEEAEAEEFLEGADFNTAEQALKIHGRGRNYDLISRRLHEFEDFVVCNSADLIARPSNTLQAAANLQSEQAPAVAAAALVERGCEKRPWILLRNPKPRSLLAFSFDVGDELVDLRTTSDGKVAAVLTSRGQVCVYDLVRGCEIASFCDDDSLVTSVALCNAKLLVTGSASGSITFWTFALASAKKGVSISLHTIAGSSLQAAADATRSTAILTRSASKTTTGVHTHVLSLHSPTISAQSKPHTHTQTHTASHIHRLAVSVNGKLLVTAAQDASLKVVSIQSCTCILSLIGHRGGVMDVSISYDSLYVVSASLDRTLRIWCLQVLPHYLIILVNFDILYRIHYVGFLQTGRCVKQLLGHHAAVLGCCFGGKGHDDVVSASADGTVRLWQASSTFLFFLAVCSLILRLLFTNDRVCRACMAMCRWSISRSIPWA
jgi:hypothetical protein